LNKAIYTVYTYKLPNLMKDMNIKVLCPFN